MYAFLCLSPRIVISAIFSNFKYRTCVSSYAPLSHARPELISHHSKLFTCSVVDEDGLYWDGKEQDKESAWSHDSAHVISQLAQCFTNAMAGPRSWVGGLFSRTTNRSFGSTQFLDYTLTPMQEERLQSLKERLGVPYDETRNDHQEALQALWDAAFPDVKLKGMISEQWKDMGWQGANPSTDFRGCGFLSLENLLYFARNYPQAGERSEWEYPFAVAGINVSFMLIQMLDLHSDCFEAFNSNYAVFVSRLYKYRLIDFLDIISAEKPRCLPGFNFLTLLGVPRFRSIGGFLSMRILPLFMVSLEMHRADWVSLPGVASTVCVGLKPDTDVSDHVDGR
ncbi:hypothetical protein SASPL_153941 [Salvia splendens]|uniref:ELMO domain-containing protein n=1 Tax=Salvia splendens TaxID=180675 RepID=A0A8X8VZ97_SALSN|nr:hypothetical protein SASPL_153941 [Salvia splendens]